MPRRLVPRALAAFLALSAYACSVESAAPAGGAPPPGAEADEPGAGGGPAPTAPDGGPANGKDAGPGAGTDDLLGTLASGSCGIAKTQTTSPSPSFEKNLLVFAPGEAYDKASLSLDGQRLFDTTNAGGSSGESEVMSFEVLRHCEGAKLLKTETEIGYAPPDGQGPNSITDILVEIGGKKVGVSVTRSYKPANIVYTDAEVKSLLEKKLEGVNRSSVRVLPADKWVKQVLHVLVANQDAEDAVARVLPTIDATLRADTIVYLTRTKGGGFLYCNPDPPLGSECP